MAYYEAREGRVAKGELYGREERGRMYADAELLVALMTQIYEQLKQKL